MKKIFLLLTFVLLSIAGFSQGFKTGGIFLRVTDSATYVNSAYVTAAHADNYADIFYSTASQLFWKWNGSAYEQLGSGGDGATAAGATGNVQYKSNGGGLQAEAALTYDSATNILTVPAIKITSGSPGSGKFLISDADGDASWDGKYIIDQANPSTASGTITLDCNSQIQRSFVGSATFSGTKTFALSNTTNTLFFNFFFEVTSVAAVVTVPSDWLMSSANFNGTTWTPPATGKYEFGGSFDDVNNVWYVKASGPFN